MDSWLPGWALGNHGGVLGLPGTPALDASAETSR
jgi:hypothetical protein